MFKLFDFFVHFGISAFISHLILVSRAQDLILRTSNLEPANKLVIKVAQSDAPLPIRNESHGPVVPSKTEQQQQQQQQQQQVDQNLTQPDELSIRPLRFQNVLDDLGKFVLQWDYNDTEIIFEIKSQINGWVGFGISRSGRMAPADVILAWVKDGIVGFGDYHTTSATTPIMDESQDWFVVHGYEDDSGTTIRFRRKFVTCDPNDEKIEEGTVHLIYAYHDLDPDVPNFLFRYHGQTQRGSKAVLLIGASFQPKPWPSDAGTIDFRHNNYQVPGSDVTTYGCTAFYLPTIRSKLHIIKTEASIQRGHENLVKNILLLACRLPIFFHLPQYHGLNFNCLDGTIPLLQYCESVFAAWSLGAEPLYYPQHVGVSIGAPEDPVLFVLQTHFHNPVQQEGIIDSSGLRLTYTRQLRRFDAGLLHTGHYISNRQIIPPGEQSFVTKIHCSKRCLEWGMRSVQAIRVFGVFFHTHELGKSVKVRSVRNSTEYQHWAFDANYSPANQLYRMLSREVLVQKGDSIRVDCEYDSTSRDKVTMGGITLTDEICRVIILYYPKQAIDSCFGWSVYNKLKDEEGEIIQASETIRYLSSVNWTNNNVMRSNLKQAIYDSDERTICFSLYQEPMIAFDHFIPDSIRNEYIPPSFNCSAQSP